MYKLSKRSEKKLLTCHNDLQVIIEEVLKYMDITVVQGYRSTEEQLEKYNKSYSQVKKGKHNENPSMAVDIQPYPLATENGKVIREMFYYMGGFVIGIAKRLLAENKITHDVRYGGDWNKNGKITDNNFDDLYHIELIEVIK